MTSINPSLQKKTAARMAAVQCLYTASINNEKTSPEHQVARLKKELANNKAEQKLRVGSALEPNYKLMLSLLEGVSQYQEAIETRMNEVLNAGWQKGRTSPLLIAILQCGVFELLFDKDLQPNIVIDEYTRLSRSFFADAEVDFVHAALSKLALHRG